MANNKRKNIEITSITDEKNKTVVSSVMQATPFMLYWTKLSTPTIWLEADKSPENDTWTISALGTTDRCRNGGLHNLEIEFLNAKSGIAIPSIPNIQPRAHNGAPIKEYQISILAQNKTYEEMLAYMVFFEQNNDNTHSKFYDKDKICLDQLSKFTDIEELFYENHPIKLPHRVTGFRP